MEVYVFVYGLIFFSKIHTVIQSFIHNIRLGPSLYLHSPHLQAQLAEPQWDAEPIFELGPALLHHLSYAASC